MPKVSKKETALTSSKMPARPRKKETARAFASDHAHLRFLKFCPEAMLVEDPKNIINHVQVWSNRNRKQKIQQ